MSKITKKLYAFYKPRERVQEFFLNPSLTKQSEKDSCDIGKILRKYHETGFISHSRRKPGDYVDLVDFPDFRENLNRVIAAEEAFASLPSAVRNRFRNDPSELIDFVSNRDNYDEAVKLGLVEPKASTPPANPSPAGGEANDKKVAPAKGGSSSAASSEAA